MSDHVSSERMAAAVHRRRGPATMTLLGAALRGLWRILRAPSLRLAARRELAALAAMSDHELRDIGLFRHDLASAAALPFREDPTEYLGAVVQERAKARRAMLRQAARQAAQESAREASSCA